MRVKVIKTKLKRFYDGPVKWYKKMKRGIFIKSMRLTKLYLPTRTGREALFDAAPKNELLLAKTSENLYYIVNSSDKVIGRSVYRNQKSFDAKHLTSAMNLIACRKSILIDAGANIGSIGIFGVSQGHFEKCIAFEPEPKNFKLLRLNVSLNNLEDKFDLRNEALSNLNNATLECRLSEHNHGDHQMCVGKISDGEKRESISVVANTLDSVIPDQDIDECLLFMDVQGFEGHVLAGAAKLIQKGVPVITEFWPFGLNQSDGLEMFYHALKNSPYTSMWDLRNPSRKLDFSIGELEKIASELESRGAQTDLIFV